MITGLLTRIGARLAALPLIVRVAGIGVLTLVVLAVLIPAMLMARPSFLGGLEGFEDNYDTLETSLHAGLSCVDCHADSRGRLVATFAATGDFYRTLLTDDEPTLMRMEAPGRDACLKCHLHDWSDNSERTSRVPHPAHMRVSTEKRECVTCHKWTAHQEVYQEEHKTMQFSAVCASYPCHVGWKGEDTCQNCHHILIEEEGAWAREHPDVVLTSGDSGCLESCHQVAQCQQCHTTGETPFTGVREPSETRQIESMHAKPDWLRAHGAVALPDQAACLTCHVSLGECQSCHSRRPASHGSDDTWISQHKNVVKSEQQCVTCHDQLWCDDCHVQFKEMR